ncbi:MAG: SanA/YdcF family protein [Aggregatilineales bacterium]
MSQTNARLPSKWRQSIGRFRNRRTLLAIGLVALVLSIITVVGIRGYRAWQADGRIYSLDNVPERPVAIVFGAEVYPDGSPSPMLADRVATAAALYQAGKVKVLLFTGDNHLVTYNEPEAMRQYALNLGVPAEAIVLDYAGFRTYDSCYRARDIFKVDKAILVTQGFHLDRALLTCNDLGIDSVGVAADVLRPGGYGQDMLFQGQLRELPSTALAVFDLLRGAKPTFLGKPLPIFVKTNFPNNFVMFRP